MSQPLPPASSQATQDAIRELVGEIAFQKVLLSSIDDSVDGREAAEDEVRAEIKKLEKEIKNLKRVSTSTYSESVVHDYETDSNPDPSSPLPNDAMSDAHDGDLLSPLRGTEQRRPLNSSTSPATSARGCSTAEFLSPSKMNLPTRKRSHSKHLDGLAPVTDNKSRRTSPHPFVATPAMSSSDSEDDEFQPLNSEFFEQQKAEEKRIQRERKDAEIARSFQSLQNPSVKQPASIASRPSAFDRMSGMRPPTSSYSTASPSTPQRGNASSSRPLPYTGITGLIKSEPGSMTSNNNKDKPSNSFNSLPSLKMESSSRSMPGSFHVSSDSDSDIEIISASEFHENSPHRRAPSSVPRPVDQSPTNTALHMAAFGKKPLPGWMNGGIAANRANMAPQAMGIPAYNPANPNYPGAPRTPSFNQSSFAPSGAHQYGAEKSIASNGNMHHGYHGYPGYSMHHQPGMANGMHNMGGGAMNDKNHFGPSPSGFSNYRGGVPGYRLPSTNYDGELYDYEMPGFVHGPMGHMNERMAGQVDYIMNDPRKTNEEIKALIENIRPDEDLPAEDREGTPEGLKYPLYEHQKLALTWLKAMESSSNNGGILADDMGLGKTITSLALILTRPSTDRVRKTTLIVGPVALVRQWEREIRKKVKAEHRLSTHLAHGGRKLSWDELRTYDIVLTTYNTLAAEYRRWEKFLDEQHHAGRVFGRDIDEGPLRKKFPFLGPKSLFYRVILDEAQCIKNKSTMAARAAYQLKALTRVCLTGTPMMNNVGELFSLIHFLRIKPYSEYKKFQADFGFLSKGTANQGDLDRGMRKLQALLKAILLRRMKSSLIDGKPLITLPPKTEEITHVIFSEDEQEFYNALEGKSRIQFNKYMNANTVGKNYSNILVLLLRLRQCCCHPHLITDFEAPPTGTADLTADAMVKLAESLTPDIVQRLLASESFECPVCYDAVANPIIFSICGHDTCSECLTKITDQANQQHVADGDEGAGTFKCPSCRAKIEKNKIIDYTTFKKVHMKDPAAADIEETASMASDSDDDSSDESESETESGDDVNGNGDLRDFVVPDEIEDEEEENDSADWLPGKKEESGSVARAPKKKKSKSKGKEKEDRGKTKRKGEKPERKQGRQHVSIAMLKKEASKSAKGRARYMRYLRKHWQPSAKVNKCVELVEQFQNDGQKTIIFSQFVSLLDLLQVPISEKGWKCERYDGSMNADARNDAINRFTDDPNTKIMLISLKAGNSGLNLVAASRVIILDPFWNPFIEMQAVDRAHRIGQQRPVEVHRILIQNTVEDRIIELQERKKQLVDEALNEGASKSLGRLGVRELAFLFGVEGGS